MEDDIIEYDAVIIGAGQAGVPLAEAFAATGRKTALIERKHIGGTCINEGCTPTKTMVASARVAYLSRRALEFGVKSGMVTVDMQRIRQRKRDMVESFSSGSLENLTATKNLDLIFGHAHFSDKKKVEILTLDGTFKTVTAPIIVINTGCRPLIPPIQGLDTVDPLDSTTIMELDELPEHLVVLGGGYVASEFAQMFRRFGSKVTMVDKDAHLLPHEDRDVSKGVLEILRQDGIRVLLGSEPTHFEKGVNGVRVTINAQGVDVPVECTHVLVAVGRNPNSDGLDCASAGIELDTRGNIVVNDLLETSAEGIYAAGDIHGGPAFTHISYDDYRILKANLIDGGNRSKAGRLVPYTLFTDPQLGRVGLSEYEAKEKGLPIKVATMEMAHVARALETGESRGFMKAIVHSETNQILGCAVLGVDGGELMSMMQIAMMARMPFTELRDAIFAHPLLAESLNNLFAEL